jgi:hypothetical protein
MASPYDAENVDLHLDHLKANCDERFKILTENTRDCDWIPVSGKILGQGKYGCTFQVCCNGDCNFIVKNVTGSGSSWEQKIANEVDLQKLFGAAAPEMVDAFFCNDGAYIVMGKKDMTIEGFVDMMKGMGKPPSVIQTQVQNLQTEATRIMTEAHKKGLLHGDLHRENMMVDILRDASGKPIAWSNLQFIDFGKSEANASSSDLQEEAIGLRDTFKLLVNYAAEPLSRKPPEIGGKRIGKCGLPTRREPPQTVQRPRFDDARRNLFADSPSTPPPRGRLAFGEQEDEEDEEEEKKDFAPRRLF